MSTTNAAFRILCVISGLATSVGAAEYHVATTGSDAADGTAASPLRTIQRAADLMQPGDTCAIHGGTYREWVRPPRGGDVENRRISYRAALGEKVVLKGSEQATGWTKQGQVWRLELDDSFFGRQNPFKRKLAGEWLFFGAEYHLGEIYLDGAVLKERLTRQEVDASPLSWWLKPAEGRTILYANFGNGDPNKQLTEITVRECIFFPTVKGLKYITLDGLHFAQAAPQWAYWNAFEEAAVGTYFGEKWTIQNCRFSDIRSVALVCGNDPCKSWQGQDIRGVGRHIVRHNSFAHCGEAAIHGNWGWAGSLIEGNLIEDINTKNEFGGMETAGMKIHYAVDVTVKGNVVRRVFGRRPAIYLYKWGPEFAGIWVDWGAQGTRVTANVVYDCEALAVFIQNSHGSPVLADNNIVSGKCGLTTEGVIYAHNLFVDCAWNIRKGATGPYWKPHSGESVAVAPIPMAHVKWWNDLFVGHGAEMFPQEEGYASDWNVFYGGAKPTRWGDQHSRATSHAAAVRLKTLPNGVEVRLEADATAGDLAAPLITAEFVGRFALTGQGITDADGRPIVLDRDIVGTRRSGVHVVAGPLAKVADGVSTVTITAGAPLP